MNDTKLAVSWSSMILVDEFISPCNYNAVISFGSDGMTDYEQVDTAIERCKTIIDIFDRGLIAHEENPILNQLAPILQCYKVTVPDQPADMVVGIMLLAKFISVTEGRLDFHSIEISSDLADGVSNTILVDELTNYLSIFSTFRIVSKIKPWWERSDAGCSDLKITVANMPPAIVNDTVGWEGFDLLWEEPEIETEDPAVGKKKIKKPKPKKWKPTIIEGGKPEDAT